MSDTHTLDKLRIDKWLWAARFYKTRSLAVDEIGKGRVRINGQECKPAREVKVGDTVQIRQAQSIRTVVVQGIALYRGPAPKAQLLYQETPESIQIRTALQEQRRYAPEPAQTMVQGRPTKRDRRQLQQARERNHSQWGDRWSASISE